MRVYYRNVFIRCSLSLLPIISVPNHLYGFSPTGIFHPEFSSVVKLTVVPILLLPQDVDEPSFRPGNQDVRRINPQ